MVSYFEIGLTTAKFTEGQEGTLVKDALVLVEGTHTDNAGVTHTFDKDRVMRNALNTNEALKRGETIPVKANHSKDVRDDLGEIVADIECRLITENDLPDPKHKHLLGKLGAFTKLEFRKNIDDIKNKIIKRLSPGIDIMRDRFVEVSAVSRPAIIGPALFSQADLSFEAAMSQHEDSAKLKEKLTEIFNVFLEVVVRVDNIPSDSLEASNKKTLLTNNIRSFSDRLSRELGVEENEESNRNEQKPLYEENPYADTIVNSNPNNQNFSEDESNFTYLINPQNKSSIELIPKAEFIPTNIFASNKKRRKRRKTS